MKNHFHFALFIVISICSTSVARGEEKKDNLEFDFALVYKTSSEEVSAINIQPSVELKTGTEIKIYIKPLKNAWIYLFHYNTEKKLSLLYPGAVEYYKDFLPVKLDIFLPDEKSWYILDDKTGTEYLYLLASTRRFSSLESLMQTYLDCCQKGTAEKIIQAGEAILDKIREIRKANSGLSTPAEIPLPIAGNVRGKGEETDRIISLGINITAGEFYGKTIRIIH